MRGGGAVHYGGLTRFTLGDGVLALDFDTEAAAVLELPPHLELALDEEAARTVADHLPRIVPRSP
ncbi:hypothetical protein GCM10023192_66710 [Amycolatopsis samaneae]